VTGAANASDYPSRLVNTMRRVRAYVNDDVSRVEMIPVDVVVDAIAQCVAGKLDRASDVKVPTTLSFNNALVRIGTTLSYFNISVEFTYVCIDWSRTRCARAPSRHIATGIRCVAQQRDRSDRDEA
jgi:hypothetical protein